MSLISMRERARKIAVVISSLSGGGAERVVLDLCQHLCQGGRDVTLLTLNGNDPDAYLVPDGVRRERMEIRKAAASLLDTVRFSADHLAEMRRKIIAMRPDVVVSFIDQTNVRTLVCLIATGIPVIVSERIHPEYHPISPAWEVARRLSYPFAKAVVVQTTDIAEWFRSRRLMGSPVVIPNAVRQSPDFGGEAHAPSNSGRLIMAAGRLSRQKGFDLLLDAYHRSGLGGQGWRLKIFGHGPERDTLLEQASGLGVSDSVVLPGFVNDLDRQFAQADIFVLSSRYEGFPNVLLEAMQMARACISFDCSSGPRDLIRDSCNGLLVPREDVEGMARALRRLADDSELRERLGGKAAGVVETFSPAKVYGRWICLIDLVAAGGNVAWLADCPDQAYSPPVLDGMRADQD